MAKGKGKAGSGVEVAGSAPRAIGAPSGKDAAELARLADLGRLTAKLMHEIRNPLGVACGSVEVLRQGNRLASEDAALLEVVQTELDYLRRLVQGFQQYAGAGTLDPQPVDINGLVTDVLRDAVRAAPPGVEVRTGLELAPGSPRTDVDLFGLRQALLSVMTNAVQALPRGGTVTVATRAVPGRLEIEIRDTGVGMPVEVRERCLEPFAVARPGGLGLGLPLARRVVEDHRGRLEIESTEGRGTSVRIVLPAVGNSATGARV